MDYVDECPHCVENAHKDMCMLTGDISDKTVIKILTSIIH